MFLNRLTQQEKRSFLAIAHHVAHSDGNLSKEEENILAKYCMEMQMDDIEYDHSNFNLEEIMGSFKIESHKKIVLLEIMALIYADGILAEEEENLINQMILTFNLNPNLAIIYKEWSKTILSLFVQGEALIHL